MIYYTGDILSETRLIKHFILLNYLTENDLIVILGDAGLNYYGNDKGDSGRKRNLNKWSVPVLCIHGNHEMRPEPLATYSEKEWNGGTVYYEEEFPNILFAKDGEIYDIDGLTHVALGGAYSVDKFYRLQNGGKWYCGHWHIDKSIDKLRFVMDDFVCPNQYE